MGLVESARGCGSPHGPGGVRTRLREVVPGGTSASVPLEVGVVCRRSDEVGVTCKRSDEVGGARRKPRKVRVVCGEVEEGVAYAGRLDHGEEAKP